MVPSARETRPVEAPALDVVAPASLAVRNGAGFTFCETAAPLPSVYGVLVPRLEPPLEDGSTWRASSAVAMPAPAAPCAVFGDDGTLPLLAVALSLSLPEQPTNTPHTLTITNNAKNPNAFFMSFFFSENISLLPPHEITQIAGFFPH